MVQRRNQTVADKAHLIDRIERVTNRQNDLQKASETLESEIDAIYNRKRSHSQKKTKRIQIYHDKEPGLSIL